MTKYLARHIVRFALLMLAVGLVVFALVSMSPIDPVQANVGQAAYVNMSEAKRAQLASYWGGDVPFWERFANWAGALLQGDMGTSLRFNAPVSEVIAHRAANSLALMGIAWLLSGVLGFALGVAAGARRGGALDRVVRSYCFLLASTPTFWLGLLILMVFAVQLGWFPIGFSVPIGVSAADVTLADAVHHLVLPALTLSVTGVANIALHTREKVVDVLESDYVRFARARGESELSVIVHHGLRAAGSHAAVCVHLRDLWRVGAGRAGVFLSRPGAGGCDRRVGRRRGASRGHRARECRTRVRRQPAG